MLCVITLSLSFDTPGCQIPLQMAVSHHTVLEEQSVLLTTETSLQPFSLVLLFLSFSSRDQYITHARQVLTYLY